MPMMMEQFSCAAGDVAQSVQTPVTGTLPRGVFLVHVRFIWSWQTDGNGFFKLWKWCVYVCVYLHNFLFLNQQSLKRKQSSRKGEGALC